METIHFSLCGSRSEGVFFFVFFFSLLAFDSIQGRTFKQLEQRFVGSAVWMLIHLALIVEDSLTIDFL